MDAITIIGIVIGTIATLSTEIWFMNRKFFEAGKLSHRFDIIEESYKRQDENFIYYSRYEKEFVGQKCNLDLNAVIFVMSVYLRDEYLKTFPFENGFSNN
jgi:hypothetical protein